MQPITTVLEQQAQPSNSANCRDSEIIAKHQVPEIRGYILQNVHFTHPATTEGGLERKASGLVVHAWRVPLPIDRRAFPHHSKDILRVVYCSDIGTSGPGLQDIAGRQRFDSWLFYKPFVLFTIIWKLDWGVQVRFEEVACHGMGQCLPGGRMFDRNRVCWLWSLLHPDEHGRGTTEQAATQWERVETLPDWEERLLPGQAQTHSAKTVHRPWIPGCPQNAQSARQKLLGQEQTSIKPKIT